MTHREYVLKAFKAIRDTLIHVKTGFDQEEFSFWPQDHKAIEYFLKKVSNRKVPEHFPIRRCVLKMKERVKLLIAGDSNEWDDLMGNARKESGILGNEVLRSLEDLCQFFSR